MEAGEPPVLNCHHCGALIRLQVWPPLEPRVAGPCPGCGVWLELETGQSLHLKLLAPTSVARNTNEPAEVRDHNTATPRMKRSGAFSPRFLPDLAQAGNLFHRTPEFDTEKDSPDRTIQQSHSDRWIRRLVVGAGMVALVAAGFQLRPTSESEPVLSTANAAGYTQPPPDHGARTAALPEINAALALKTLAAISSARTAQELMPWIIDPDRVGDQLNRYYRQGVHEPDLRPGDFRANPLSTRDWGLGIAVMERRLPDGRPLQVFLKQDQSAPDARFRLDWETYVQEKERLLPRFVAGDKEGEGIFRVILRRQHIFDQEGNSQKLGCLGIGLRTVNGELIETPAILNPGEELYERLSGQLAWGHPQLATVKLAYQSAGNGKPRLTITEFLCWELAGVGGTPNRPLAPPPVIAEAR